MGKKSSFQSQGVDNIGYCHSHKIAQTYFSYIQYGSVEAVRKTFGNILFWPLLVKFEKHLWEMGRGLF